MPFYFFDIEFFIYFFRVLHEASSSWLKFLHAFQKHPVLAIIVQTSFFIFPSVTIYSLREILQAKSYIVKSTSISLV
jgi:hypothetical protein